MMSTDVSKRRAGSILTAVLCTTFITGAAAEQPPPDLSSGQFGWLTFQVEYARPAGPSAMVRNDPAHPRVSNADAAATGRQPTFFIADLSNPNLKPWVTERMRQDNAEVLSGKVAFTPHASCMPAGVPAFHLYGFQPVYFVQTPKEVVMIFSGDLQVRRIYLDVPHSQNPKPSWYGESVGHYEDGALVIDTIGFNDKTFVDSFRTPHSERLHVVERLRVTDGGRRLEVNIDVDDPEAFNAPWSAIQRYDKVQEPLREQVCAENNKHLFDYHIPEADKPDF